MDDQAHGTTHPLAQDRRIAILDAAEACFARAGFHRTTMQDIAAAAAMSVGNLYRYFASKDAVIIALGERDRAEVARDFAALDDAEDFLAAFRAIGEKHLRAVPATRSAICLEIWAEATRNAVFAEITRAFEMEVTGRLERAFALAQARGAIRSTADPRALAITIGTLADGLFVRRAVSQSFDAGAEIDRVLALVGAILHGAIDGAATISGAGPARPATSPRISSEVSSEVSREISPEVPQ
ncbi:TetR/AcrR family transcriptional regulator [Salinarimonas rosea]|uniref:TetR/AcrR family transcriptional regulator n=1 Tax=Salinarimonas rosea TaxID=552063 RepID=UPI000A07707B|nr:TetR/AcrR family transcriptional regulator [Salinarimonas rosea]